VPPASTNRSRIANDVASSVRLPMSIAPRLSTDTEPLVAASVPIVLYLIKQSLGNRDHSKSSRGTRSPTAGSRLRPARETQRAPQVSRIAAAHPGARPGSAAGAAARPARRRQQRQTSPPGTAPPTTRAPPPP